MKNSFLSKLSLYFQSATIILSPLYILRTEIVIPTTLLEVLVIISFLVTLLDFLTTKKGSKVLKNHFNYIIAFFLVVVFIEVFVSPDLRAALGIYKAYFIEPVIFFFCLLYTSSKFGFTYILNSLLLSAFWLALFGSLQKFTGKFSLAPYEIIQGRVSAVYNSANSLALYLGPIAFLSFGLFAKELSKKRWLYLLLFLFFCLVIVWTKSRGGEISVVVSLVVFGVVTLFSHFKKLEKYAWSFTGVVVVSLAILAVQFYQNTNFFPLGRSKAYTEGDTLQIRYFIWAGTINMLKDHPVFGAGLDGFKTLYSNQYRLPQFQEQFQYPHNIILTFWTETGLLGLSAFFLVFAGCISALLRGLKKNKDLFLGTGLIGAFSYMLIHGMVDVPYFKNDLSLEFWVLVALTVLWEKFTD